MFFTEPETVASDDLFQKAIMRSGRVVLPVVFDLKGGYTESGFTNEQVDFMLPAAYSAMRNTEYDSVPEARMVLPTLNRFASFARTLAHINMNPDIDGTLRWELLAIKYRDDYYAPIGLQAARLYLDIPPEQRVLDFAGGVHLGSGTVPTDDFGRMLINYRGPNKTFPMYPLSDLIDRTLPAGTFKDKIVMIGATAIGIYDLRVTPYSTNMAGIEKHASVVDKILKGDFLRRAPDVDIEVRWIRTTTGTVRPAQIVLAAGAHSSRIARDLGVRLPIEAAKGYSVMVQRTEACPRLPTPLKEARVYVTPLGDRIRLAGTFELAGVDMAIARRRLDGLAKAVNQYLAGFEGLEEVEVWRGLRPMTPDTMPILGKSAAADNLTYATGHGMVGVGLGAVSGKIAADLVAGQKPPLDLKFLAPSRFGA